MAQRGFTLATPLGLVPVQPENMWRDANAIAATVFDRIGRRAERLTADANAAIGKIGAGLTAAEKLNGQLLQAQAKKGPKAANVASQPKAAKPTPAVRSQHGSQTPAPRPAGTGILDRVYEAGLQADAAVRGVADTLTFGLADEFAGGMSALADRSDRPFLEKYSKHHENELARDAYDSSNRALARKGGQAAGLALTLGTRTAATAARAAAPKVLSQLRSATALGNVPRLGTTAGEVAILSGAAGLANGAAQTAVDIATGGEGTLGDFIGAVGGGAVAAPFAIFRAPSTAGAVEGAATSMLQDAFNGRPISYDAAIRGSAGGAALGHVGDVLGAVQAKALGYGRKGKLGERLSMLKTRARGELPIGRGERRYLSRGYTVVDPASTLNGTTESKFGEFASMSDPQLLGHAELPNYRVDWWLPADVGKMTGFAGASLGSQIGLEMGGAERAPVSRY